MKIRATTLADSAAILLLYQRVADIPGGLARLSDEISADYVQGFLSRALTGGLSYVAIAADGEIVGEIHAYTPGIFCFSHLLSELTIAVSPDVQGQGVGRRLFESFMSEVEHNRGEVLRVELIARESNAKAITFYESLGFSVEGRFERRIRNLDGRLEADIPMAWLRKQHP